MSNYIPLFSYVGLFLVIVGFIYNVLSVKRAEEGVTLEFEEENDRGDEEFEQPVDIDDVNYEDKYQFKDEYKELYEDKGVEEKEVVDERYKQDREIFTGVDLTKSIPKTKFEKEEEEKEDLYIKHYEPLKYEHDELFESKKEEEEEEKTVEGRLNDLKKKYDFID